jgi:hypothetical protein
VQNRLSPLTEATEKQRNQMVGQLQCHGNAARRRQATFSSSFERQFSYGGGVMESRKAWGADHPEARPDHKFARKPIRIALVGLWSKEGGISMDIWM